VQEFVELAFGRAGLDWKKFVKTDPRFVRPPETIPLHGNPKKAQEKLGWKAKISFQTLVEKMVDADLALVAKNLK